MKYVPSAARLLPLVRDAYRFVLFHQENNIRDRHQVYDDLLFCPSGSLIKKHWSSKMFSWVLKGPILDQHWSPCIRTLEGHSDWVREIAISSDGRLIASCSDDRTICLWDAETGILQNRLEGHTDWVTALAFSPNGLLASCSGEEIIVWTCYGGSYRTLPGGGIIRSLDFSPDAKHLASASSNRLGVWEIATTVFHQLSEESWICVRFSSDGEWLVAQSHDNKIEVWDTKTHQRMASIPECPKTYAITFLPFDKNYILSGGGDDNIVRMWDLKAGNQVKSFPGHRDDVSSISCSPNGHLAASGSDDRTIRVWDTQTGALKTILSGHNSAVQSVKFDPSGQYIVSASNDRSIRIWDCKEFVNLSDQNKPSRRHSSGIHCIALSPTGDLIVSGSEDGTIGIWSSETGENQHFFSAHSDSVLAVAFSPDGQKLASTGSDNLVQLWDLKTGYLCGSLSGHQDWVRHASFSPQGSLLASASDDRTIRVWDTSLDRAKIETAQKVLEGHQDYVRSTAWSADKKHMASCSDDGVIFIWDAKKFSLKHTLKANDPVSANSIAFRPHTSHIVCAAYDDTLSIWDFESESLVYKLNVQRTFDQLSFTNDLNYILTEFGAVPLDKSANLSQPPAWSPYRISEDGSSIIPAGKEGLSLPTQYTRQSSCIYGHRIAIGCEDGQILFFELER